MALLMLATHVTGQVTQLSQYTFQAGFCTVNSIASATTILGTNVDDGLSGVIDIGFTFVLGGTPYTQFKVNSNGYLTLGTAATSSGCCGYVLTSLPSADRPALSIFSKDLHNGSDGFVAYAVSGSAPNRVLTVHWKTREYPGSGSPTHTAMQIRLYEGSNKIEFWYGANAFPAGATGGIGVIINGSNFAAVNSGAVNYGSASNSSFPSENTCYSFTPCQSNVAFTGNVAQGGTANMANGDSLLTTLQVVRGSQAQRTPFTAYNGTAILTACGTRNYSYSLTGPYAGEYSISPTSGTLTNGSSSTPVITFRPAGTGLREATLTVTDDAGLSRSFKLHGKGVTRIKWSGDITQGGTTSVVGGDTLLNGTQVLFGTIRSFTPLIVENTNLDPLASPPASVTYTLNDPTGHYSISPASALLNGGQTSLVSISFNAVGSVGFQEATLTVNADGESRTYLLRAFNAAPGGEFFVGSRQITSTNPLFVDQYGCVGTGLISLEITARNTGAGDFVVYGGSAFESDTMLRQGTPPYPLLRNGGQPVTAIDYFITNSPGIIPKSSNPVFDSIVIPEKGSRTFYLNMVPSRPGKRYGIAFFRTNGFNMSDPDENGVPTRGVLQAGLFGHGQGSGLNGATAGKRPGPVVIGSTEVRDTRTATAWLYNNGECDLRISRTEFRFESGDASEFNILKVLPNTTISGDDFVLAPGAGDSVVFSFTPNTYGSRRATIRLATNDSTLGDGEVIERGSYYWDIYGEGSVGLEARGVTLPPAILGGPTSHGFVLLENTSAGIVQIQGISITGGNNDIIEDPANPWPTGTITLQPGQKLQLWVALSPDPTGTPGPRSAQVVVQLSGGKTLNVQVQGYVGTRLLSAQPGTLFNNIQVRVGDLARQYVAVTNIGTLPIHLNNPVLVQTNPGDYRVNPLIRRVLEPGQTELLEVTYTPQGAGVSSGTLTFSSDGTNGSQVVNLGGEGTTGTKPVGGDPAVTGSSKVSGQGGLQIMQISPNPARSEVSVQYSSAASGEVRLMVYDGAGHLVSEMLGEAGDHQVTVNVSALPSGIYHCVLQQGEGRVSQEIRVVK